jgi:hypothetical protein
VDHQRNIEEKEMTFNINEFKSELQNNGYLKNSAFRVRVSPPTALNRSLQTQFGSTPYTNFSEALSFRVEEAKTPSPTLVMVDINRYGVGPTQKQPVNAQFNDTSFSVICDRRGLIWSFWNAWINTVFSSTPTMNPGSSVINKEAGYSAQYKSLYSTTIYIDVFDQVGELALTFELNDAFPIQLREIPLDWLGDDLIYIDVVITYRDYAVNASMEMLSTRSSSYSPRATAYPSGTVINIA